MSIKNTENSSLQGISRLITEATIGITDLVEAVHQRVTHPPLLPSTPVQDLVTKVADITYQNIRWSTKMIGSGLDKTLGKLAPLLGEVATPLENETLRSALNGIIGDYLEAKDNPLKITMQFRHKGKEIPLDSKSIKQVYPTINGKILVLVHGLCMNDLLWTRKGHNHGEALANELNLTPIYLNYNSGRHISANGQDFNELLEKLVQQWPVPVEELTIVAHSMGGLVSRSALFYGQQQQKAWTKQLKKLVFLGTPHHGAALEQAGNYLDGILEAIPYAKPFARLGKMRSAGITDLRYGNLIREDWQGKDRFEKQGDRRHSIPLPEHVDYYSIAAIIGKNSADLQNRLLGDGLVAVESALGLHVDQARSLLFREPNTWIAEGLSHLGLLNDGKVYDKLKEWLII